MNIFMSVIINVDYIITIIIASPQEELVGCIAERIVKAVSPSWWYLMNSVTYPLVNL